MNTHYVITYEDSSDPPTVIGTAKTLEGVLACISAAYGAPVTQDDLEGDTGQVAFLIGDAGYFVQSVPDWD